MGTFLSLQLIYLLRMTNSISPDVFIAEHPFCYSSESGSWTAALNTVTARHLSEVVVTKPPSVLSLAAANRGNTTGSSETGDALGKALASVSYNPTFNLDFTYLSFIVSSMI